VWTSACIILAPCISVLLSPELFFVMRVGVGMRARRCSGGMHSPLSPSISV